jgi:RNA polymerase sigma-70 factor (ECF subfamily)
MATDKELVKRVQNGESEAYAELYQRYYRHIYTICVSMVKNPQDAEELAQEMFVHAYLKVGQLRDPARFFPWLKKIARNRSRNFIQRREANVIPLCLAGTKRSSANPDEEILRQELIQAVMEAIEALPVRDRQVVKARIDGLSHAEISRRFSISYRASLSRLYRARKKLAEHLKGLFGIFGFANISRIKGIASGGIVAMKISAKTGLMISGTTALLMLVGTGILVWRFHQPEQEIEPSKSVVRQSAQQVSRQSLSPNESGDDSIANRSRTKPPDEQSEEKKQIAGFLAWLNSLEADSQMQDMAQSGSDSADADERKKAQDEAAQLEHEREVEAARQQVISTIVAKADELEWIRTNVRNGMDFKIAEPHHTADRELGLRLITVDIPNYMRLTRDYAAAQRGGWIYELCIENGFTIGPDPYEVVKRKQNR